eukprot:10513648-Alexandrium_andersonii.AAC.1
MARAAAAQRGDLRAGAAPSTAPGMASISLMRPGGRPGPPPARASACRRPSGQQPPRPPRPHR